MIPTSLLCASLRYVAVVCDPAAELSDPGTSHSRELVFEPLGPSVLEELGTALVQTAVQWLRNRV